MSDKAVVGLRARVATTWSPVGESARRPQLSSWPFYQDRNSLKQLTSETFEGAFEAPNSGSA